MASVLWHHGPASMHQRLKASSVAIVLACASLAGQQADRSRTEALARRAADRLQALQAEADRLASEERTLLGDLRRLEIERQIKIAQLSQATSAADRAASELNAVNQQVDRLEAERQMAGPDLSARIVELYKMGQGRYLKLLLSISDVGRIGEASRTVAALAAQDRSRIASYQQRLDELKTSRAALEFRQRELGSLRVAAERARAAADHAVAAQNNLIHKIDNERDLNAQLAGELQGAQQRLQGTLRALSAGSRAAEPGALPLGPFRGALEWPVAGTVLARFGRGGAASNGLEIAAAEGTPVRAVHEGAAAYSGPFAGLGNLVILDHGGQNFSLYGNLREAQVAKGDHVAEGDRVGLVGRSPAGPEALYFELRIDGRPADPLQWLKKK